MHLALVGTPNSGKTALFNALTGSRQKVANYPGVTVERKAGTFVTPRGRQVSLVDLPGTYSLRGRSPDEEITRDVVLGRIAGEALPDLVLCVADATNLRLAHPPGDRTEAHRPAADAGAQHDRHRAPARHRHRPARSCPQSLACRWSPRSRCARRHRGAAAPDRRDRGGSARRRCAKTWQPPTVARSARRAARGRPHHQGRGRPADAARHLDRRGSTPCCCIRSPGSLILR